MPHSEAERNRAARSCRDRDQGELWWPNEHETRGRKTEREREREQRAGSGFLERTRTYTPRNLFTPSFARASRFPACSSSSFCTHTHVHTLSLSLSSLSRNLAHATRIHARARIETSELNRFFVYRNNSGSLAGDYRDVGELLLLAYFAAEK